MGFTQLKNIQTAFQQVKLLVYLFLGACLLLAGFAVWRSYAAVAEERRHIYILANGKALEAVAADRKQNIPVEARDMIRTFHADFFDLDPDDKAIRESITKALYLGDESVHRQYQDLQESGYYNNLISGNISQQVSVDSIRLDMDSYPYGFVCYAQEKLLRSSSVTTRSLVTRGYLRNVARSDHNPHGFLIERWETLENKDNGAKTTGP